MTSGPGVGATTGSMMNQSTGAFVEGSPVDVLLFGFKKNTSMLATSFNASASTDSSNSNQHVPQALKHMQKVLSVTRFSIATVGPDGRRLYTKENLENMGGVAQAPKDALLQTKI